MATYTSDEDTPVEACPDIRDGGWSPELMRKVRACAGAITRDPHAVNDVVQLVREKLLKVPKEKWDTFTHKEGYVMKIAQNESRNWLRSVQREKTRRSRFMDSGFFNTKTADTATPGEAWDIEDLIRLFKPLRRKRAQAYILVRLYGFSVTLAGVRLKLPEKVVQAHVDSADLYFVRLLEGNPDAPSILARFITLFRGGQS